jgi:hypothetical protein
MCLFSCVAPLHCSFVLLVLLPVCRIIGNVGVSHCFCYYWFVALLVVMLVCYVVGATIDLSHCQWCS